ncbi:hypothetical protein A4X09_0g6518 [Tilletia walkeri]|uniref:Uncharacterized protein n=1 Tax=Tilletia walkeri TaxID=117179 RepID=A0A8X7T2A6_9BASI|nr:hypothetical protein A4X09_0g6518 [Tilletia walkeri]
MLRVSAATSSRTKSSSSFPYPVPSFSISSHGSSFGCRGSSLSEHVTVNNRDQLKRNNPLRTSNGLCWCLANLSPPRLRSSPGSH